MTAKIISGKEVAAQIKEELKEKISMLTRAPKLAVILVGHDEASEIYVRLKQKAAQEVGIETVLYGFETDVGQETLEDLVKKLNADETVNGILIQLPLPKGFDERKLLDMVLPIKDVDGFHPYNMGLLQNSSTDCVVAATPKGVLELIKKTGIALEGKNALVIGRSNIVGKPMAMLLLGEDCTVTIAHSKTKNVKALCQNADVVVSATGCAKMVKADWIKEGAVVIDVGTCRDENGKMCGDVDFDEVKNVASYITPVPGGVGPMTIAMLLKNTFEAYLKQHA